MAHSVFVGPVSYMQETLMYQLLRMESILSLAYLSMPSRSECPMVSCVAFLLMESLTCEVNLCLEFLTF